MGIIEDTVFDYWVAVSEDHDVDEQAFALDGIRPVLERIVRVIGFAWGQELELFMKDACLNFSRSLNIPFLEYFVRRLSCRYRLNHEQEERMLRTI